MPQPRPSRTGSNVVRVGSYNQAVVLDAVRRAKSISRVEIAELTGLSTQTVTNISRRLLEDGYIVEAGKVTSGFGKPRTALEPNPGSHHAIGVLFDPDASSIVLLDLAGHVRARETFSHSYSEDPGDVIAEISARVRSILDDVRAAPGRVLGIGVGAPGPIDLERGMLQEPPNLPLWHDVPLRSQLAEATGLPVVLDKDVVAAAVAESWYGSGERRDTTAVVYVGTGIGIGVCLEGEVFRGTSGNAGEIGHVIVDADGPRCSCGARGCVAVSSAPSALATRFVEGDPGVGPAMLELVLRSDDEPLVSAALTAAADGLFRLSENVAALYDVQRVIFGGPMWEHFRERLDDARFTELETRLAATLSHPVRCRPSNLGNDLGAVGAACLVFDRFLSPQRSQLLLHTGR